MKFLLVFFLALFFCTTNCEQHYALLGVSHGYSTTIWIQLDVGGECSYTMLEMVNIGNDSLVQRSTNYFSGDSTATRKFIKKNFEYDSLVEINKANHSWTRPGLFSVSAPEWNARLRGKYKSGGYQPKEWNKMMGDSGMVLPTNATGKITLLYAAPEGFYVNYWISRCWYSPTAELLIVFTKGSEYLSGDSSDGYLIFHVRNRD